MIQVFRVGLGCFLGGGGIHTSAFTGKLLHGQAAHWVTWECTNPSCMERAVFQAGFAAVAVTQASNARAKVTLTFPVCMHRLLQASLSPLSQDTSCGFLVFIFITLPSLFFTLSFPCAARPLVGQGGAGGRCWVAAGAAGAQLGSLCSPLPQQQLQGLPHWALVVLD